MLASLEPRAVLRLGVLCAAGLLVALGVRSCPDAPSDNPAYDALAKAHTRRMVADSVALDSARKELAAASQHTQHVVTRYQELRDTLNIHDTLQVIVFRDRADAVKRSCVAEDNSCERFRVRADSTIADLRLDRDRWRLEAEHARPSGFDLFVRRTLPVVAFVGGVYVGSRVTR